MLKEAEPTPEELIIGTWQPVKYVEMCPDGRVDVEYVDSCQKKDRFEFGENGILRLMLHSFDEHDVCDSVNIEETWEIINESLFLQPIDDDEEVFEFDYLEIEKNVLRFGMYFKGSDEPLVLDCFEGGFDYFELERVK